MANFLVAVAADDAGNLDHSRWVKIGHSPVVGNNQRETFAGVLCQSASEIDNVLSVGIRLKAETLRRALFDNLTRGAEDAFLATLTDLVGAGVVGVGVLNHIVREEIVLEVGVRDGIRIERVNILSLTERLVPRRIDEFKAGILAGITVFSHLGLDSGHKVIASTVVNLCPPAKVIEAVVADNEVVVVLETTHLSHDIHQGYWHIANVDDL